MGQQHESYSGGRNCGRLRYVLRGTPLFVHACHCLKCQKAANSAFSIGTIVLEKDIDLLGDNLVVEPMADAPHRFRHMCGTCGDHIFRTATSHPATALLRTGSLDDVRDITINAHIWTETKHGWLCLPDGVPQFEQGYDRHRDWPADSLRRLAEAVEELKR